jgi:hypothetical protein
MGWFLLQLGVYALVAWSDIHYHWSGWKHGDPLGPIVLLEFAAMWSATVVVSALIDFIRYGYRPKGCGTYDVGVRARLDCGLHARPPSVAAIPHHRKSHRAFLHGQGDGQN